MTQHISPASEVDRLFTVTELCREYDVTARALRFYESKGLLHPLRVGTRRRYRQRERARLALILRGKRFGLSLTEIGELLDLYDVDRTQVKQLSKTLEVARRRLREMRDQRAELDSAIDDLHAQIEVVETELAQKLAAPDADEKPSSMSFPRNPRESHGTVSASRS